MTAFMFNAHTSSMFLRRASPCVYFVQELGGGPVKIGRSNADGLDRRMVSLQVGNPRQLFLRALVCLSGSNHVAAREEGRLHKHFSASCLRGEWFSPSPELNTLMDEFSMERYGGQLRQILRAALDERLTEGAPGW